MTQQDYSNDLVFRSNTDLGVKTPTASISFNTKDAGEIAKFTEEGFYYKGEFVDDAGEVHRLLKQVLGQMKTEQQEPTDEELLRIAASAIEPYEGSGIAPGEYEPETECAVEVYSSELIAYARAVLTKWGTNAQ